MIDTTVPWIVSQLGFILAAPEVGCFHALTHGLVKTALFLISSILLRLTNN